MRATRRDGGAGLGRGGAAAALLLLLGLGGAPATAADLTAAIYACASGQTIRAGYDPSGRPDAGARLVIGGRTFDLYPVRSASGARFATEQGLRPDHGLQWWIKGEEATLSEMAMDHTAPEPRPLDTCRLTSAG